MGRHDPKCRCNLGYVYPKDNKTKGTTAWVEGAACYWRRCVVCDHIDYVPKAG